MTKATSSGSQAYAPHIHTYQSHSRGVRSRILGRKSKRVHHVLSNLEAAYFLCLDLSPRVSDIQEQKALDVEKTLNCAKRLEIKHPYNNKRSEPWVLSTDFYFYLEADGQQKKRVARSIKHVGDFSDGRTQDLAKIEQLYWQDRKIDWGVVTELDVDRNAVRNAEWLGINGWNDESPPIDSKRLLKIEEALRSKLPASEDLGSACVSVDRATNSKKGTALGCIRYFVNRGIWDIDPRRLIRIEDPLVILTARSVAVLEHG